ncbi:MAG: hypothetical protein GY794_13040 [bacterium]|nr:hypothetical protein [bacterium]
MKVALSGMKEQSGLVPTSGGSSSTMIMATNMNIIARATWKHILTNHGMDLAITGSTTGPCNGISGASSGVMGVGGSVCGCGAPAR